MTLKQCIEKFGVDASRVALADAGDTLDDANFDEAVANASILKLFKLEEWITSRIGKIQDADDEDKKTDKWDLILENELKRISILCHKAYSEMKYKNVIKHAFNELVSVREAYMMAKDYKPNPACIYAYIHTVLVLMNPIAPHFCQFVWKTHMLPSLKATNNSTYTQTEQLLDQGWPAAKMEAADPVLAETFAYL